MIVAGIRFSPAKIRPIRRIRFIRQLTPAPFNCRKQQVHIYTPDSIEALTDLDDTLTGGAVLPGFKCKLRKIFLPASAV